MLDCPAFHPLLTLSEAIFAESPPVVVEFAKALTGPLLLKVLAWVLFIDYLPPPKYFEILEKTVSYIPFYACCYSIDVFWFTFSLTPPI